MKALLQLLWYLGWFIKVCALTFWLAGCAPSGMSIDATASRNAAGAIVAVIDSVNDHYQPALPNDLEHFGEVVGAAAEPTPATKAPDLPAQDFVIHGIPQCRFCRKAVEELCQRFSGVKVIEHDERSPYPKWIEDILRKDRKAGFPFIEWHTSDGKWHYIAGWPGWEKFNTRYQKTLPKPTKATAPKPEATATAAPWLGNAATSFSSMAQLREHVATEHRRGWKRVNRMSDADVIAWHDAQHGWASKPARGLRFSLACPFGGGA